MYFRLESITKSKLVKSQALILIVVIFLVTIVLLVELPTALNLIESKASATNIPQNQQVNASYFDADYVVSLQRRVLQPRSKGTVAPKITATAALVKDLKSDYILFVKEPNKRVPIASTTKIMTAIVATDYFKANDVLSVPAAAVVDGSTMGLKVGEKLTFRSLLYGMLLNSGNDAAYTIAANYPGGVEEFVKAMNLKAKSLGLINTYFDNPAGFDSANHFSSASDLTIIAQASTNNSQVSRVVATKETVVASIDKNQVHNLKNLNKLLDQPGVSGIKTGTTPQAKENLVALIERNNRKFLVVVLGSEDRFAETANLIGWVGENYIWE